MLIMRKKDLYRLINEEIGNFDFLGNSKVINELSHEQTVNSKDFQTKLVHQLLTNSSIITNAIYTNKESSIEQIPSTIELELEIEFSYNNKIYSIILLLEGEDINEPDSFNLKLFSKGGEEIDLEWVKRNPEIYSNLIKFLLSPYK